MFTLMVAWHPWINGQRNQAFPYFHTNNTTRNINNRNAATTYPSTRRGTIVYTPGNLYLFSSPGVNIEVLGSNLGLRSSRSLPHYYNGNRVTLSAYPTNEANYWSWAVGGDANFSYGIISSNGNNGNTSTLSQNQLGNVRNTINPNFALQNQFNNLSLTNNLNSNANTEYLNQLLGLMDGANFSGLNSYGNLGNNPLTSLLGLMDGINYSGLNSFGNFGNDPFASILGVMDGINVPRTGGQVDQFLGIMDGLNFNMATGISALNLIPNRTFGIIQSPISIRLMSSG